MGVQIFVPRDQDSKQLMCTHDLAEEWQENICEDQECAAVLFRDDPALVAFIHVNQLAQAMPCLKISNQVQVEEDVQIEGLGVVRIASVSRENAHTFTHTGLLRWESSLVLAQILLKCPTLLSGKASKQIPLSTSLFVTIHNKLSVGKRLLELGCGSNPVVALAAQRNCRSFLGTDGSPEALQLLASNLSANAGFVY